MSGDDTKELNAQQLLERAQKLEAKLDELKLTSDELRNVYKKFDLVRNEHIIEHLNITASRRPDYNAEEQRIKNNKWRAEDADLITKKLHGLTDYEIKAKLLDYICG